MAINIPDSFDTKEVNNFNKSENILPGNHKLRIAAIKAKENRNGKPLFIVEFVVVESDTHPVGEVVSVALDLTADYGQADIKRLVSTIYGPIAAVEPYLKEEKNSAGKVIKKIPVYAKPSDPNAITKADILTITDEAQPIHQAVLGSTLKCRARSETYTPTKGANVGKEMTVVRLQWTLDTPTEALADLQAQTAEHIEQLNLAFEASLAAPVAA